MEMESQKLLPQPQRPSTLLVIAVWARNHLKTMIVVAALVYLCYLIVFLATVMRKCPTPIGCSLLHGPCLQLPNWCLYWMRTTSWSLLLLFGGAATFLILAFTYLLVGSIMDQCRQTSRALERRDREGRAHEPRVKILTIPGLVSEDEVE